MASPKNKKSKMRKRQREAQLGMKQAHHVCPNCGMYNGRKVLSVSAK